MFFNLVDYFMEVFGLVRAEFNEQEAAAYIGKSVATLRAYRCRDYKRVPRIPYHKKGRAVFYWRADLDRHLEARGVKVL